MLWGLNDSAPPRFRCHTGHSFTLAALDHTQETGTDDALWRALRSLQERQQLVRMLIGLHGDAGEEGVRRTQRERRIALGIEHLRALIDAQAA